MTIRSQAPSGEGSEARSQDRRFQAESKRPGPHWGHEMVRSSRKREAAKQKLLSKRSITPTGCWEWTGSRTLGYGSLKLPDLWGDFKIMAHRLSYVVHRGEPITGGLFVCHTCDNRACFNPDHLFLGTQRQNLEDCSRKGRTCTGETNGNSRYSDADIAQVQRLLAEGLTGKEISQRTGVSRAHVSRIKRGETWSTKTASRGDLSHGLCKHSEEQLRQCAQMLRRGRLKPGEIAQLTGVSLHTVKDMKRGKVHKNLL